MEGKNKIIASSNTETSRYNYIKLQLMRDMVKGKEVVLHDECGEYEMLSKILQLEQISNGIRTNS